MTDEEELAALNANDDAELSKLNGASEPKPPPTFMDKAGAVISSAARAAPAVAGKFIQRVSESADPVQQVSTLISGNPSLVGQALGDKPAKLSDRLRAALQGATFMHGDEAESALDSVFGKKTYGEALAANRPVYKQAVQNAPAEFMGSALASPNPMSKVALPASLGRLGRVLTPAIQGAGMGALAGEGDSEQSLKDSGPDALKGALTGFSLGLGGGVVGEAYRSMAPALKRAAEEKAFQSLGARVDLGSAKGKLKAIDARSPKGDPLAARRELGRRALDEGIVRPFGTAGGASERADPALEKAGEVQGGLLQAVEDAHPQANVSLPGVGTELENKGRNALLMPSGVDSGNALLRQSQNMRDAAMRRQASGLSDYLKLTEAEAEKRALQAKPNYAVMGADQSAAEEARKAAASAMRQAIENEVERVAGPQELEPWLAAKKKTGQLADILDVAQQGAQRESTHANKSTVLPALQMAARHGGSATGAAADAVLGGLGNIWKQRRPATMAHVYDLAQEIGRGPSVSKLAPRASTLSEYFDLMKKDDE